MHIIYLVPFYYTEPHNRDMNSLEKGLQICKLVLFDTLIWQSNGDCLHLFMVPVLWVNVLGKPPNEEGVLEQAPVWSVPWNWIV